MHTRRSSAERVPRTGCARPVSIATAHPPPWLSPSLPPDTASLVLGVGPGSSRHWLESMHRDGLLVPVGTEHYLRADAVNWPQARLLALRLSLPPRAVVGLSTAVWAMGGPGGCQRRLVVIVPPSTTVRPPVGVRVHRLALPPDEVIGRGGVRLTCPVRTAADLALWGGHADGPALLWLLEEVGVSASAAWRSIRRRGRLPGLRRAGSALRRARSGDPDPFGGLPAPPRAVPAPQTRRSPEPTRYTSKTPVTLRTAAST